MARLCTTMVTSGFARSEAPGYGELAKPPPLSKRWSARLVHRAQAPDQRFRVRAEVEDRGFSGLFSRDLLNFAHAALCGRATRAARTLRIRDGSAVLREAA